METTLTKRATTDANATAATATLSFCLLASIHPSIASIIFALLDFILLVFLLRIMEFPDHHPPVQILARFLEGFHMSNVTYDNITMQAIDAGTPVDGVTITASSSGGGNDSITNPNNFAADSPTTSSSDDRDPYEFVAFLLWYLFLVVCCVLPTCLAYRRRRIVEARMAFQHEQQRAQLERVLYWRAAQQNNGSVFLVNGEEDQPIWMTAEEIKAERTRRITAELEASTFTVQAKDITENDKGPIKTTPPDDTSTADDTKDDAKPTLAPDVDEEMGGISTMEDYMDAMDETLLTLPPEASSEENTTADNTTPSSCERKTVPGGCAICLCVYEPGDIVTWSRNRNHCLHAFHTECIIPWLVKKNLDNEPKCPCCRQAFCQIEPILSLPTMMDGDDEMIFAGREGDLALRQQQRIMFEQYHQQLSILTPFGLIPTAVATPVRQGRRGSPFFAFRNNNNNRGESSSSSPPTTTTTTHVLAPLDLSLSSLSQSPTLAATTTIPLRPTATVLASVMNTENERNDETAHNDIEIVTLSSSPMGANGTNEQADEQQQQQQEDDPSFSSSSSSSSSLSDDNDGNREDYGARRRTRVEEGDPTTSGVSEELSQLEGGETDEEEGGAQRR